MFRTTCILITLFCGGAVTMGVIHSASPCNLADHQMRQAQAASASVPNDRVLKAVALNAMRVQVIECTVVK